MVATVSGYSHVAVSVTDLDAARDFYCDVLGFEVLPRPDFGFPGLWLRVGELQLHLGVAEEAPSPGPGFPHFALYVPTEEFDKTIEAMRAAGVKLLGEPSTRVDFGTTVHAAFIIDPSGNVIELRTWDRFLEPDHSNVTFTFLVPPEQSNVPFFLGWTRTNLPSFT